MALRFLGDGDKVKASLRFKGRQMAHRDLGYKIVNRLIQDLGDAALVEFMPRMEGTTCTPSSPRAQDRIRAQEARRPTRRQAG
jgi:translation initiation factor IF-3